MDKNEKITFLSFTAKYSEEIIHDVAVDLAERNYTIEITNLEGRLIQDPIGGPLRRRSVRKYQNALSELDVISWPILEHSLLESFPTKIDHLVVVYSLDDDVEQFETIGRTTDDLVEIHKKTEQLINHTFGSYEFYKE